MDNESLVRLWLHGRSPATQKAYRADVRALMAVPFASITLEFLQARVDRLHNYAPRSKARIISAIKSLFAFLARVGALPANPAAALRTPPLRNDLAERILTEDETKRMFDACDGGQEYEAFGLLYYGGLRASEAVGLRRRDVRRDGDRVTLTVFGKGGKTRAIVLPALFGQNLWGKLEKRQAKPGDPVLKGHGEQGRALTTRTLLRIVKRIAERAGLSGAVSPHWLRHSHASHALDRGAPVSLVRDTLGHASIATTDRYAHAKPNTSSAGYLQ